MTVFHLAYTVSDLETSRQFYGDLLGCEEGRSTDTWVDFNFFGNQLSLHLGEIVSPCQTQSSVEGITVPMPHFGCVLEWSEFQNLSEKLKSSGVTFVLEPHVRYARLPAEQATMFIKDPSGNALEFKAYRNNAEIFSK
ncbi:MAG: VOC family protein [Gammaproteobacteria bacterium]